MVNHSLFKQFIPILLMLTLSACGGGGKSPSGTAPAAIASSSSLPPALSSLYASSLSASAHSSSAAVVSATSSANSPAMASSVPNSASLSASSFSANSAFSSSSFSSASSANAFFSSASASYDWVNDGRFGVPASRFTLPETAIINNAIYLPDIQASFPSVNWASIDRLYIPAGHYNYLLLGNLPSRSSGTPLVITNTHGQVTVGGAGHYYVLSLSGGSNWVLTGRYDPISETGHPNFAGHRHGAFANSQGTYGIVVDDAFSHPNVSGLQISGGASRFEVEYIEIARVGFAGILAKTDRNASATMEYCKLHDLYIHDTGSEGLYIGSTQAQPQHQIRHWDIYNNRILRTGTEALQLGQLGGVTHVHHNVLGPSAIDWRSAFQINQDGNIQITLREGQLVMENNIAIGSAGTHFLLFSNPVEGDAMDEKSGVTVRNNYFSDMRNLGLYIGNGAITGMQFTFENNLWRAWQFERNQVYETATAYDHLLRNFNTTTPITFTRNSWEPALKFSNSLPTGNGVNGNVSGSANSNGFIEPIRFVNSGLPDGFNVLRLERWTAAASLGGNAPVSYPLGMIVMHQGKPWRCRLSPCPAGLEPPSNPSTWEALTDFADDVRVEQGTPYAHLGLTPRL